MDHTTANDSLREPERDAPATDDLRELSTSGDVHDLIASLKKVRREGRLILLATRLSVIVAWFVALALALGVIDFALRFPMWIRGGVWAIGLTSVAWAVYRQVKPAWQYRPSLTDLALRIENSDPKFKGLLASAVDFSRSGDASRTNEVASGVIAKNLADRVVRQAGAKWKETNHAAVIRLSGLTRRAGALASALSLSAMLLVWSPAMWSIGAERVLAPWSGISWPKRTGIVDITEGDVHPLGTSLPLRAALTKTNRGVSGTMVAVRYRLVRSGRAGATRRELLTWQGRNAETPIEDSTGQGALFERLLEPMAEAIEFRFETEDDKTAWRRIRLIEPPAVVDAQAIITPPEYAAQVIAARRQSDESQLGMTAATIDLGPGTDERAIAPPSLAGSTIELVINVNREVDIPAALKTATDSMVVVEEAGTTWRFRWTLNESTRLPIKLVDEYGIESVEDIIYRFESLADRPSSATITKPESDRTVLPTAVIDLVGEGRDDVGLSWVAIEQEHWTPAGSDGSEPSGPGGALRRAGEPAEIARSEDQGSTVLFASATLDLGVLGVRSGDEIRLTATAQDLLSAMSTGAEPTRSMVRRLRIISETEFVDEIRGQLAEIRQRAHSIEQRQVELRGRTQAGENNSETRRGQAQVTERVARQGEQMQRLLDRVEENALDNPDLQQLMDEAKGRLTQAGEASTQASEQLSEASERAGEASQRQPGGEQEDPDERVQRNAEEAQEAAQSQRDVQDALNNLIELLDRGEDNLAVKIGVQRLLDQQRALRQQTQQAGQQTAGKPAQELSPQEQSDLQQIVDKQNQIAGEFDDLLKEMRDRQEELEQHDSSAAQAMAQAANRAEQQQVSEQMRQAAQQASQNQTARAQQQQQKAEEALEELLDNLDEGEKAKDEALRLALKSIIESLESVIVQLTTEIGRLDERDANKKPLADLDEGMIRVNRNTLGILDLAEVSGSELGPIANLVERASDAQGAAISEMRFPMASAMSVRGHESRSLELLNRALEEAEELDEQIEKKQQEDKLRELRRAYREILETQVDLREQSELLATVEKLTRRDRVAMRGLSESQELVRDALTALLRETQELTESGVFSYAHKRLDAGATRAIDALSAAKPARAVRAQKSVERGIRGILEALKDPKPDDSPFDEPEGGGGGEGGGDGGPKPLIPPVKELMLLRDIQTDIAGMTSELNDAPDSPELPQEIKLLADDQRSLMDVGKEFLEKAKNNQPAVPDMPGVDRPDDDAEDGAGEPIDPFAEPNNDTDEPVDNGDGSDS